MTRDSLEPNTQDATAASQGDGGGWATGQDGGAQEVFLFLFK